MENHKITHVPVFIWGLTILLIVTACAPATPAASLTPGELVTETQTVTITEIIPTQTLPQAEPTLLVLLGTSADAYSTAQVQTALEDLADQSGFDLLIIEGNSSEIANDVEVMISIGDGIDINNLALRYPEVSFVAVDNSSAIPAENVSVIGNPLIDQRHRSFMAGYLAAVISNDYKVAALAPSETGMSEAALESFVIGARFFCGICQPKYPPYQPFPQWETLSLENYEANYPAVLDYFKSIGTEILYIHGDLASPELLTAAADLDIKVVSDKQPETIRNNYVGTVISDPAPPLRALWPEIVNGNGGSQIPSDVALVDRDADLVSEGRYQLFLEMVNNLQRGLVSPEAAP